MRFQTRDITGKADAKYKACPSDRELVSHREILYGNWKNCLYRKKAVLVEGAFDVWRVGNLGLATFGIQYSQSQLSLLSKLHKITILFDPDPQAQKQARKIKADLVMVGVNVRNIRLSADPADTSQEKINKIIYNML